MIPRRQVLGGALAGGVLAWAAPSAGVMPLIVGADFNSTYDHRQYREMLANSSPGRPQPLVDAAEQLGAGIVATYPAGRRYPALLAIDKRLHRGAAAEASEKP